VRLSVTGPPVNVCFRWQSGLRDKCASCQLLTQGAYTARILKGEKSGELPAQQRAKLELYINLKSAKAFGLNVPNSPIGRAEEVIE
jgi:hypothetical protein